MQSRRIDRGFQSRATTCLLGLALILAGVELCGDSLVKMMVVFIGTFVVITGGCGSSRVAIPSDAMAATVDRVVFFCVDAVRALDELVS